MKKYISCFFICLALYNCNKYPEDSKTVHFSTPKDRLTGWFVKGKQWDCSTCIYNFLSNHCSGYTTTHSKIYFYKDGEFHGAEISYLDFYGRWKFLDKKNALAITDNNGIVTEYKIVKLDNDALWFQSDSLLFKFNKH